MPPHIRVHGHYTFILPDLGGRTMPAGRYAILTPATTTHCVGAQAATMLGLMVPG